MKRTILFAATLLFTVSAVAHVTLGQGKSSADAAGTNAGFCSQDTAKPPCTHAPAEIKVAQNGDEFLVYAQSEVDADRATIRELTLVAAQPLDLPNGGQTVGT